MIRNLLLITISLLFLSSCRNTNDNFETIIPSSNLKTHLYFNLNDGEPYYLVYYNNDILIDWSMLGIIVDDSIYFNEGLLVKSVESKTTKQNSEDLISEIEVPFGICNEITINLENNHYPGILLFINFRVYNNAIAYKYSTNHIGINRQIVEKTELDLYNELFNRVVIQEDADLDTTHKSIIAIESIDTLRLPATFVSEKGYELSYFQSYLENYPTMELYRRSNEKQEYQLIYAPDGAQSKIVDSVFESPWRIIYFTNKQNTQNE